MFKEKQQNTHAINPIKYLFNSVTKVCSPLFGSMPWNCCTEIFWEFFCGFKGKASFRWNKVSTEEIVPGCGWLFTVFWGLSRVKGTQRLLSLFRFTLTAVINDFRHSGKLFQIQL